MGWIIPEYCGLSFNKKSVFRLDSTVVTHLLATFMCRTCLNMAIYAFLTNSAAVAFCAVFSIELMYEMDFTCLISKFILC